ncbi:MAG: tetratricopeptide repeat protein [Myxococcales bacterium]|nr:tetratricopeptide repeat protein [Myxococcales bacterium]
MPRLGAFVVALPLVACPALISPARADDAIRRDPAGITGISPYNEALAKGREAFNKGDHAAAISAFDEAAAKEPERILAHLLKAQAQLAKGDTAGAAATAETAAQKDGPPDERSKLAFFRASLAERSAEDEQLAAAKGKEDDASLLAAFQKVWDRVKERWTAYSGADSDPSVTTYPASANDRRAKVDARMKRERDYAVVRGRAPNK